MKLTVLVMQLFVLEDREGYQAIPFVGSVFGDHRGTLHCITEKSKLYSLFSTESVPNSTVII